MIGFSLIEERVSPSLVIRWISWKGRLWLTVGGFARLSSIARHQLWHRIKKYNLPSESITMSDLTMLKHLDHSASDERFLIERSTCIALVQHSRSRVGCALARYFFAETQLQKDTK